MGQRKVPKGKTAESDSYLGSGTLLLKAIQKYGRKQFSKEIIHECYTQADADTLEIQEIEQRGVLNNRESWYNRDAGGQYGRSEKHSAIASAYMKELFSDEIRYSKYLKAQNEARVKKGLKPLTWLTLDEKIEHKKQTARFANKKKATLALSKHQRRNIRAIRTKANKPHAIRRTAIASWADKDKRKEAIRKGRAEAATLRANEGKGYWSEEARKGFAIGKLKQHNNIIALSLINCGVLDNKTMMFRCKRLITSDYKHMKAYVKQLNEIVEYANNNGMCMSFDDVSELVSESRRSKGKRVYSLQQ